MKKARQMSMSAMGGGDPAATGNMDPALVAGPVLHSGWLKKRTDIKDGKPVKNLKYDTRYCTLNTKALLVRRLPWNPSPCRCKFPWR